MVPGNAFSPNKSIPSPYLRAAFSVTSEEQMNEALMRFAKVLKEENEKRKNNNNNNS
jgi:DNA-binding transcriptional MocR family regulator